MASVQSPTGATRRPRAVQIAGVLWPLYKVVALVGGLLIALVLLVVTGSPQIAVLAGAAAAAVCWIVGWYRYRR